MVTFRERAFGICVLVVMFGYIANGKVTAAIIGGILSLLWLMFEGINTIP